MNVEGIGSLLIWDLDRRVSMRLDTKERKKFFPYRTVKQCELSEHIFDLKKFARGRINVHGHVRPYMNIKNVSRRDCRRVSNSRLKEVVQKELDC